MSTTLDTVRGPFFAVESRLGDRVGVDDASGATQPSADRAALGSVIAEHVRAALRHLPTEQRPALGLAYYGGYTQREVASITGVPVGTVKSRMFTGVARLRVLLAPVLGTSGLDLLGDTW